MTVILHALLLDVPEELRTERLVLRATRSGQGAVVNEAVMESFPELKSWMPWSQQAQSLEDSEKHCRDAQAKWHSREMLDFCFFRASDGQLVGNTPRANVPVSAGQHTIRVARDGYETFERTIRVEAGEVVRITDITLAPRP